MSVMKAVYNNNTKVRTTIMTSARIVIRANVPSAFCRLIVRNFVLVSSPCLTYKKHLY